MSPNAILSLCILYLTTQITRTISQEAKETVLDNAADRLSEIFAGLKHGLATDRLQREYASTSITYSQITDPTDVLSSVTKPNMTVQRVIADMNLIIANSSLPSTVENCCSSSNGQTAEMAPCCQSCDEVVPIEVATAARVINTADLNDTDVEMSVGYDDGIVVTYPPPSLDQCEGVDARLRPWYNTVTQTQDKELVIFLDLNDRGLTGNSSRTELREAALNVIQSLAPNTKVALVVADNIRTNECPGTLQYATPKIKAELTRIIEEQVLSGTRDYPVNFKNARNYFSNSGSSSNRMLLLLSHGLVGISGESFTFFEDMNNANTFSNFLFRIYTANTPEVGNAMFNFLEQHTNGLGSQPLSNIINYAQDNVSLLSNKVYITTDINRNNELCLSISKAWINDDDDLVGVVNTLLPWQSLMSEVEHLLLSRTTSYYFILGQNGVIFYHSLFDDLNVVDVEALLLETEPEFMSQVYSVITNGSYMESSVAVQKTIITHRSDQNGLINRVVPSTYSCRQMIEIDTTVLHACIVLATEDTDALSSFNISDIQGVYRDGPSSRFPIYHTLLSESSNICNSFCLVSVENQVSLQFTFPLTTPNSVDETIAYLRGIGPKPSDVKENIADEVAVVSVVSEGWLNRQHTHKALPIKRRHLATPTGLYLSYPAIQLNTSFVAQYLPWYKSAITNRGIVSLLGARADELDGVNSVYTASYPVIENNIVLSVLAADVSERSLRSQVMTTVELCQRSDYDCSIINNRGDFVLRPGNEDSVSNAFDSNKYFDIMRSLHTHGLLIGLACRDQTDPVVSYRLYSKISDNLPSTMCFDDYGTEDCFCISSINGTDSYLLVVKNECSSEFFRLCQQSCAACSVSKFGCPCDCDENICKGDKNNISAPICPETTPPNYYEYFSSLSITPSASQCQEDSCCVHNSSNCELSPHCNWCSTHSVCLPLGTCCSNMGGIECCDNINPTCLTSYCVREQGKDVCPIPVTTPTVSPTITDSDSSIDRQGAIIGGVIGGVFGLLLLGLLIVCCVWYQVCRPDQNEEQTKPKSEFNFTDIKVSSVNKTAIELKGVEPLPENGEKPPVSGNGVEV